MVYKLQKVKLNTSIINQFIIKYKIHSMVTRRSRRVPRRSTTSLFFNELLYTLIHFRQGTQKSTYNINSIFYMTIKFDELLSKIDSVLQNSW